jgi:hypothetical protein
VGLNSKNPRSTNLFTDFSGANNSNSSMPVVGSGGDYVNIGGSSSNSMNSGGLNSGSSSFGSNSSSNSSSLGLGMLNNLGGLGSFGLAGGNGSSGNMGNNSGGGLNGSFFNLGLDEPVGPLKSMDRSNVGSTGPSSGSNNAEKYNQQRVLVAN